MKDAPSNSDSVIDSRDVITRIEEFQEEREALVDAITEKREALAVKANAEIYDELQEVEEELKTWDEDNGSELKALTDLADEASGSPDWTYGETLIRDSYFEKYAMQLAEDIGAVDPNATWPNTYIDWDAAADALKQDYTQVDFDGVSYWIRS